jgi:hypothetical protein
MCLQTIWKEPKIAEEDIVVYKILNIGNDRITSPYRYFTWNLDTVYETEIKETTDYTCFDDKAKTEYNICSEEVKSIGRGFHSALNKKRLSEDREEWTNEEVIFKCIIPKGSEYYIGLSDLVVSNRIIIKEKVS